MKIKWFIYLCCIMLALSIVLTPGPGLVLNAQEEEEKVPFELDNTKWEVEMVSMTEKGKKDVSMDTLIFMDNQFISEDFEKKGYDPTNYSLTVEDSGATKFGTMQVKNKETSFWKGEVSGDRIDGSVHTRFSNDKTRKAYFSGKLIEGVLRRVGEEPPPPPPAPEPAVATDEQITDGDSDQNPNTTDEKISDTANTGEPQTEK